MLYTNPVVANITIQFFAFFSSGPLYVLTVRQRRASLCNFHYYILSPNIYILIALALDESLILDVLQFPMKNIYQSCGLGRAIGRSNVNASQ